MKTPPFSLFFACFTVLFLVVFNFTLPIMGSIYIVGELGGSNYITTYAVIFYCLGNALGVPLGKPISDRIGITKLLVYCLLLFALFSWVCGVAPNYPFFITARLFQGLVSGPFYILVNRLIAILAPQNKKSAYTSTIVTIFSVTPVLGASWGGWISYDYSWRWLFYFNIPFILFLAWFLGSHLKKYTFPLEKNIFDGFGYFFYCIGVFCLCFMLTTGQEFDWFRSPLLVTLTVIGIPCFIFFILWELQHPNPVVDLKLLKKPVISFALFNLGVLFSAYFGMVILLSLWLKLYADYTPIWIAVLIGTMAVAGILPTFLIRKYGEVDCRIPLTISVIFLAISCFYTAAFDVEIDFGRIAFSRVLAGFGLVLFLPPIFRLCFHSFPEKKGPHVVVLFQAVRSISCGLGAGLYVIVWQRRQTFYRDRLGSRINAFSQETKDFFSHAKDFQLKGLFADAKLSDLLDRQATSLALDDCFYLMGWILVGLLVTLILTLFFREDPFFPEKNLIPNPSEK